MMKGIKKDKKIFIYFSWLFFVLDLSKYMEKVIRLEYVVST